MYYSDKTKVFLNGKWLKASEANTSLFAQSLHYGSGVFEGIRAYNTDEGVQVFKAEEHYERLKYSASKIHAKIPYTVSELTELTYELLEKNNLKNAYIRPLVYLGANMALTPTNEVNLFICAWEWGRYLGQGNLDVMTSSYQRPNPKSCFVDAKVTGHYTNSILATSEAKQKGYDEALLLDANGNVAEGSGANFFFEINQTLYTPPTGNILPGITRSTVIDIARDMGYSVVETYFTTEEVKKGDGAFFTGTAAEVAGIRSLDGSDFRLKWEDTIGHELSLAYNQKVLGKDLQYATII